LKAGGESWIFGAQGFNAGGEALDIELVDREGAVATLRAAWTAGEPDACSARGIG
jgi:hypothetical protein